MPEILYRGDKYVVLKGQPDDKNSKIGNQPVIKGKDYVFRIDQLGVDINGMLDRALCRGPLNRDDRPYHGNIHETDFGKDILPKLEKSLLPSRPTEQMIQQSYLDGKAPVEQENATGTLGETLNDLHYEVVDPNPTTNTTVANKSDNLSYEVVAPNPTATITIDGPKPRCDAPQRYPKRTPEHE